MTASHKQPFKSITNIKELLNHPDIIEKNLNERFGISNAAIQSWETGMRNCPKHLLDLMLYKLGHEEGTITTGNAYTPEEAQKLIKSVANVTELRARSGFTQKQFSDYFGISHRAIQNWEGGKRTCPKHLFDLMTYKMVHEGIIKPPTEAKDIVDVKELRACSGFTQKQFSDYFGMPPGTLPKWENGERNCPRYLFDLMVYKMDREGIIGSRGRINKSSDVQQINISISNIKELCEISGFSQNQFHDYFGIPSAKAEQWKINERTYRKYVLDLMTYKMIHEGIINSN